MWAEIEDKSIAVFDTEANGLLDTVTKMLCASIFNAKTKEGFMHGDAAGWEQYFFKILDSYEVLAGHNIIGYDLPMLYKLYHWKPKPGVIILDTLWMSRMYHPDIEGGHSLGAWGARLGNDKQEYYPVLDKQQPCYNPAEKAPKKNPCWDEAIYTENMAEYCHQDVNVNVDVFLKLCKLLQKFSFKSIKCEMDTALIIQRQMEHGFVFDYEKAEHLHALLTSRIIELEGIVHEQFKPIAKLIKEVQPKVKKDGSLSSVGLKSLSEEWESMVPIPEHTRKKETVTKYRANELLTRDQCDFVDDETGLPMESYEVTVDTVEYHSGSYCLIEWQEFSLGSRQQIAERLLGTGYKLTKKTEKGNYIIDDVVLQEAASDGVELAKPLAEYFLIQKREGMVKDWLSRAKWHQDQGVWRIHGYVNSMGANSHRMTHSSPNVAQTPSASSPYGEECRSLFKVRKGYKLVGCDASGLELRTLAHYMGDPDYIDNLLNGDIHTINQEAAGLPTRNNAKTFIYGFLYGAGDAKIGQIVNGTSKDGKRLKESFLEKTPALKALRKKVLDAAERGWLKGFDGRILRVRSKHSALNTLLQGMGAIVMKYWLIEVANTADEQGLDWNPSANVHDEGQFEVAEKDVEAFKKICVEAFPKISEELGSRCLLEGEAMEGDTWLDTH